MKVERSKEILSECQFSKIARQRYMFRSASPIHACLGFVLSNTDRRMAPSLQPCADGVADEEDWFVPQLWNWRRRNQCLAQSSRKLGKS